MQNKAKGAVIFMLAMFFMSLGIIHANASPVEQASPAQRNIIQAALGDQYPISDIAVVKSSNHKKAYYVGAVFNATGVGKLLGIWLVGGTKDRPTLVFSVNGDAHQFSGMRKASETKAAAYSTDPEAKKLKSFFGM